MTDDDNRNETGTLQNESTDSIQPLQKCKPGSSVLSWISTGISVLVLGSMLWSLVGRLAGPSADEKVVIEARKTEAAGDVEAAADSFRAVLVMKDASEEWRAVAEYELARQAFDRNEFAEASVAVSKVLEKQKLPDEERLQALMLRISCSEKLGDYTNVRQDADAILATADVTELFQARALMMRAMALSNAGDMKAAIQDGTRGLAIAKGLPAIETNIQYNRALDYKALGRTEDAMHDYSAVIKRGTPDVDILGRAYHNRGIIHFEGDRFAEAIADSTAGLKLPGASAEAQQREKNSLVRYYSTRGLGHAAAGYFEAAISDATQGLRMAEGDAESESQLQYNRALHYEQLDRFEESLKDYSDVIERGSPDKNLIAWAYNHLGAVHNAAGNREDAISDFKACLDLTETSVDVRVDCLTKLCDIFEEEEDFKNAFANAEAICEIDGLSPTQKTIGLFLRGSFALKLGESERAIEDLTQARDLAVEEDLESLIEVIDELAPQLPPAAAEEVTQ